MIKHANSGKGYNCPYALAWVGNLVECIAYISMSRIIKVRKYTQTHAHIHMKVDLSPLCISLSTVPPDPFGL